MYVHHVRFVREWTVLKKTDGSFIEKRINGYHTDQQTTRHVFQEEAQGSYKC